eukprot:2074723-Rhodomonas_salina.1
MEFLEDSRISLNLTAPYDLSFRDRLAELAATPQLMTSNAIEIRARSSSLHISTSAGQGIAKRMRSMRAGMLPGLDLVLTVAEAASLQDKMLYERENLP